MKNILTITAILLFCFTVFGLLIIYPNAETDYNEFLSFYYLEQRLNEVLVSILFLVIFLACNNRFLRSLSIFGFTVTFSSLIDKVFFLNFDYLYTDIIIIATAFYLSYITYKNGKNTPRNERPTTKNHNPVNRGNIS